MHVLVRMQQRVTNGHVLSSLKNDDRVGYEKRCIFIARGYRLKTRYLG